MLTSYEVGAVFRIADQASAPLLKISESLARLEKQVVGVKEAFASLSGANISGVNSSLLTLDRRLVATGETAAKTGAAISQHFVRAEASIVTTTSAVSRLNAELALARRGTAGATTLPTGRGTATNLTKLTTALDGVETRLGKVAPAATAAVDAIVSAFARADAAISSTRSAVALLSNEFRAAGSASSLVRGPTGSAGRNAGSGAGASPPGGAPPAGGGRGGGGGHAGNSNWQHVGIGLGMGGMIGMHEVGHALSDTLKHASELEHVRQQMVQAGFKDVDIAKALAASWKEANTYGISVAKVMGDIKELTLPFGSVEHAIDFIEPLEKMRIVLNAVSEGKGNQSADAVYKMARAGELKGLQDPKDFMSYFENMTKAISASGGKITPNDFMQATKYSKLSGIGFSEEYFTKYLPTLIQTMGASTAGTASQSLFSTLVQGTVTKRALGRMEDLGLIGDPSKVVYDKHGDPRGFNPGAIEGTELLVKNPFKWAQKVLLPLLEKKYGSIDVAENKQKAIEDLGGLFGNRNSAAAVAELALRGKTFNKDAALIEQSRGLGGADQLQKEDPNTAAARLKGAWENLLTAIGGPGVRVAVDGMNALAGGITSLTKFANANPSAMKILLEGLAGLGVAFAALSAVGVVAGAALLIPGGGVALAVTGLVSILGTIAAFNLDGLKDFGSKYPILTAGMKGIADAFMWVLGVDWAILKIAGSAILAFTQTVLGVAEKIASVLGGLPNHKPGTGGPASNAEDGLPGVQKQSFQGEGFRSLIQNAAFGGPAGASSPFAEGVYQGVLRAMQELMGRGGASGGFGGGGGIVNASFSTGGGANDNFGGASGVARALGRGGAAPNVDGSGLVARGGGRLVPRGAFGPGTGAGDSWYEAIMRAEGTAGKDPYNVVLGNGRYGLPSKPLTDMTLAEAYAFGRTVRARHGASSALGAFQIVGRTMKGFMGEAGLSWNDKFSPENQRKLADVIQRHQGFGAWEGFKVHPGELKHARQMNPYGQRPAPTAGPPPKAPANKPIMVDLHMDGKKMGRAIAMHQADDHLFPRKAGGMDTHGSFRSPGTPVTDAA